jgi:hypothetical protein
MVAMVAPAVVASAALVPAMVGASVDGDVAPAGE